MNDSNTSTDRLSPPKIAPGPGDSSHMWDDPTAFFLEATHKYGDLVYFNTASHPIFLLNHPDYIKHVLQDNYRNYRVAGDNLKLIIGDGLFVSEGNTWLQQRRIMQPSFHRQRLAGMFPTMTNVVTTFLKHCEASNKQNSPIDILAEMTELTTNLSAHTMFSIDVHQQASKLAHLIATSLEYANAYFGGANGDVPSPEQLLFQKSLGELDQLIYRLIHERRKTGKDEGDLLSMLLQAKDEETGEGMTDKQLRDQIITMWIGGQTTTAIALMWTWYLLSTHSDVEAKFRMELSNVLGNRPLGLDDLPKLAYGRMIIDEALRLYPPAWLTARRSVAEEKIGGYDIPANSEIYISPYVTHRHLAFWNNPEHFDPERFSPERSAGRKPFAYLPFGGGPRLCIGNNFALMAIQVILTIHARSYHLSLEKNHPIKPKPQIILSPNSKILMIRHKLIN